MKILACMCVCVSDPGLKCRNLKAAQLSQKVFLSSTTHDRQAVNTGILAEDKERLSLSFYKEKEPKKKKNPN